MPPKKLHRATSYTLLLINTLCWGAGLVIVKPSLEITTPFRYLLYRYIFAAVVSTPLILYYWSHIKKKFSVIKTIVGLELIGTTAALSLLYLGLAQTSAIEASLIANTTPLFVVTAGVWFLKEKAERFERIGIAIACLGTLLITFIPFLEAENTATFSLFGNSMIIVQNILTALYLVLAKSRYRNVPKFFVTAISFYVGALSFFVLSIVELQFSVHALSTAILHDLQQPPVLVAAGYMAIFGSIIGLTAYIKGQEAIETSEASIFWYLQPLVYIPLSYWLLNEPLHFMQVIGLVIILSGVFIAENHKKTR